MKESKKEKYSKYKNENNVPNFLKINPHWSKLKWFCWILNNNNNKNTKQKLHVMVKKWDLFREKSDRRLQLSGDVKSRNHSVGTSNDRNLLARFPIPFDYLKLFANGCLSSSAPIEFEFETSHSVVESRRKTVS